MTPIENRLAKIQEDIEVVQNLLKIKGQIKKNEHRMMLRVLQGRESQIIKLIEKQEKGR